MDIRKRLPSLLDLRCACTTTRISHHALCTSTSQHIFFSSWYVPNCLWSCPFWHAFFPAAQPPSDTQVVQHALKNVRAKNPLLQVAGMELFSELQKLKTELQMHVRHLQDCLHEMRRTRRTYTRAFDIGSEYPEHDPFVVYWARVVYRYPFLRHLWDRHMRTVRKMVWAQVTHIDCVTFLRALYACFPSTTRLSPCSLSLIDTSCFELAQNTGLT